VDEGYTLVFKEVSMKYPAAWIILAASGSGIGYSQITIPAQRPLYPRAVKTGAPYTADEVSETIQTLADGTHITRIVPPKKVYRDAAGRTRTEPLSLATNESETNPREIVEIMDPVAKLDYTLDVANKVAYRRPLKLVAESSRKAPVPAETSKPAVAPQGEMAGREDLGTQTIEGVRAEGFRFTTTYPIGSQNNDRPIAVTRETWMSPELKLMLISKHNDPRSGEYTDKLTNVRLGDLDPALFQIPPDYTIKEETGAFTIQ
jgi:hypothetical protein